MLNLNAPDGSSVREGNTRPSLTRALPTDQISGRVDRRTEPNRWIWGRRGETYMKYGRWWAASLVWFTMSPLGVWAADLKAGAAKALLVADDSMVIGGSIGP